jgi:ABC-type multidrug transport system fused ATPase/permease subunit
MSRKDLKYRGTQCINCETSLDISKKYCHHCGQLNSTKKLTIRDFIEEFFANFYAYDSRLRNSIISIFTKPGILAKEYNKGKRHTYANPFRLFLSVSIILFITFNLTEGDNLPVSDTAKEELAKEQFKEEIKKDSAALKILNTNVTIKDNLLKNKIEYSRDSIYTKEFIDENISSGLKPVTYTALSFRNFNRKYPEKTTEEAIKELGHEVTFYNKTLFNKSKIFKSNDIESEVFDYFYQKLPFFIFLSLPILTLMFWLVFYSKKINYTEHLVFAYTFFTFIFLCMILFNLIILISETLSNFITGISFAFFFPLYFYKSLRNFYEQSRWITIIKFILLNPLFFLLLSICALVMMLLGIILF